jgi:hypothetical protein
MYAPNGAGLSAAKKSGPDLRAKEAGPRIRELSAATDNRTALTFF